MVRDELTTLYTMKYTNQQQPTGQQQSNKKGRAVRDELTLILTNKYLI